MQRLPVTAAKAREALEKGYRVEMGSPLTLTLTPVTNAGGILDYPELHYWVFVPSEPLNVEPAA